METINSVLEKYVTNPCSLFYRLYRAEMPWLERANDKARLEGIYDSSFHKFFQALNPETRLNAIEDLSHYVFLRAHNWPEIGFFRRVVLNREISDSMRYERYRDHTMHSFLAFLLGAYLYEHSRQFKACMLSSIDRYAYIKYLSDIRKANVANPVVFSRFALAMQDLLVSVYLHDTGYIFEGSYDPHNPWRDHGDLDKAGMALSDFFLREWPNQFLRGNLSLAHKLYSQFPPPRIDTSSIASAANSLRNVAVVSGPQKDKLVTLDAFDIFRERAGIELSKIDRWRFVINTMEHAFEKILWHGMPLNKKCMLDHGIVTGLLLLQLVTYFNELLLIIREHTNYPLDRDVRRALKSTFYRLLGDAKNWVSKENYESGIRRICGASFHNINPVWLDYWYRKGKKHPFPLDPRIDGIVYIPMLLDVLQDWDRPSYPLNLNKHALDGLDIYCRPCRRTNRVEIIYRQKGKTKYLKDMREDLSRRLMAWNRMIKLQ